MPLREKILKVILEFIISLVIVLLLVMAIYQLDRSIRNNDRVEQIVQEMVKPECLK